MKKSMLLKFFVSLCTAAILLTACVSTGPSVKDSVTKDFRKESYLNGIVYQFSAEVKGLQMQAFQLAKIRFDQRLKEQADGKYSRPIAVVTDIDDTLISDAAYMADIVQKEAAWDNGPWTGYYDAAGTTGCTVIPGALEFMKYVSSKGVEVFYITNRDWDKDDLTVKQLQRLGFPNADAKHVQVMNKASSSNKTERRSNVLKHYDVVMYLGDNIGDFTAEFARELGSIKRSAMATNDEYRELWGDKWIVLPNATYGDYVGAAWNNDKTLTAAQRSAAVKQVLDYYKYTNKKFKMWYTK